MRLRLISLIALLAVAAFGFAQDPPTPPKVHEVGKSGLTIEGTLAKNDPPHQVFLVRMEKGQAYQIDLKSKVFDAFLIVEKDAGKPLAADDDSGGGLDSRIVFEATATATYRILVVSLDQKLGAFRMNVRGTTLTEDGRLILEANRLNGEVASRLTKGDLDTALLKAREACEIFKRVYPESKYPRGHPTLATNLDNVGFLLKLLGRYDEAKPYYDHVLTMRRRLYPESEYPQGSPELAKILDNLGDLLERWGRHEAAQPYFEQALTMRRKVYPESKFPQGHLDLADSLNNLGALFTTRRQYAAAQPLLEQGLAMRRNLYPESKFPQGHRNLAESLNNLAALFEARGQYEAAQPFYEQALTMRRKLFPESKFPQGHNELVSSLSNLGVLFEARGQYEAAHQYFKQALAMAQKLYPESKYPQGHRHLAGCLLNLAALLTSRGQYEEAQPFYEQALGIRRKLYPESKYPHGHPELAHSLHRQGFALQMRGQYEAAQPFYEQALAMQRQLYPESKYPQGNPDLADSLNDLGCLLRVRGQYEAAQPYFEQALAMTRTLYPESEFPQGHRNLAISLNNLGRLLQWRGEYEAAQPLFKQALAMKRKLYPEEQYPRGHPDLATSLTNLGILTLDLQGQFDAAQSYLEQALAMRRKLYPESEYPQGHPALTRSSSNLGLMLYSRGKHEEARNYLEQALAMRRKLTNRLLAIFTESEALEFASALSLTADGYLSLCLYSTEADGPAHAVVWTSRHLVTRLMEQRHASARAAGTSHAKIVEQLQINRRRTEGLLHDSKTGPAERTKILDKLGREREDLERELAKALPILERWKEQDGWNPADLVKALPAETALVEVVQYVHFGHDPKVKGKAGETRTPSYAVFIVASAKPSVRIELGEAKTLDDAAGQWLRNIDKGRDTGVPQELAEAWAKIAKHLPEATRTLYVAPDGELARIPWAALPGRKPGTVLLEQYPGGVATVPHGLFLLEAFKQPRPKRQGDLLAVGDLDYGNKSDWVALPGTAAELKAIVPLPSGKTTAIAGKDATTARLAKDLSAAAYAHFATHGFFDEKALTEQKRREQKLQELRGFGEFGDVKIAWKNPAGFTGLVLSNGEVMTGLALVDLPLENLNLVTLSACETGLGELTGGEGVQGLQRAFHVAGCPNVVASLWKVNDAATAALMTKFYHELWVNKKPPIEALREAQLTVYRSNPDRIAQLAGLRGRPEQEKAVRLENAATPARTQRTSTRLWAAFVLSGAGR